jgi:hypothetical protein
MARLTSFKQAIREIRTTRTRLLLALACAAGLLLSGCGADQAQPAPLAAEATAVPASPAPEAAAAPTASTKAEAQTSLPEPCTLLTQADLASALSEPFQAGEAGELPVGADAAFVPKNCAFQNGDKQVVLTLIPASSPYQEQREMATYTNTLQAVDGLGDEAFWQADSNELWVVQGQSTVVLGLYFTQTSAEAAKPLMQQVLSRLR